LSSVPAIAGSFLTLMTSGTIFRGGLEIGLACEIGSKEIYGPALLKAHDSESKIAKYPAISGFLKSLNSPKVRQIAGLAFILNIQIFARM